MSADGKTVLLIVPRGFAARLMAQTEFLPTLQAAGVRLVLLTPEARMPSVLPHVRKESLVLEPLRMPSGPPPGGKVMSLVRTLVKTLRRGSMNGRKSPGFAARYRRMRAAYSGAWPRWLSLPVHLLITQGLWRSRRLRQLVCWADVALTSQTANQEVFERHRPDIVVGAGLGYFPQDEVVLQEASRRGVKTAALFSGWDNCTTRGYRAVSPDLVVAWSERMRGEIARFHDVPPERIQIGGVPHWDPYMLGDALPSREELCAQLGLDPAKKLVFHATFPPTKNPEPFELIATALADAVGAGGEFGEDVQLMIRLHPKHMNPDEDRTRGPYEALATRENVHLNRPDVIEEAELRYEPSLADGRILGGLLKHCDVLVNIFSTTTLEGFLLGRPVVMAAPNAHMGRYDPNSYVANPLLWTEFVHLQPLVDSGAARVAYSREDLIEHVAAYLDDPSLEAEKRREMARLECGPTDGHAGERTARFVLDAIEVTAPPAASGARAAALCAPVER